MGVWRIVGTSWKAALTHIPVVGLVAVACLIYNSVLLALQLQQGKMLPTGLAYQVEQFIWSFITPLIVGGCLSVANTTLSKNPTPASLASFWKGARWFYWRLLGVDILTILMILLLVFIGLLLFVVLTQFAGQAWVVGLALWLVVAVPIAIALYLLFLAAWWAPVAIAVQNMGIWDSLWKGMEVGRAALGKSLLVSIVLLWTLSPAIVFWIPHFIWFTGGTIIQGLLVLGIMFQSVAFGLSFVVFAVTYVHIYRHVTGSIQGGDSS